MMNGLFGRFFGTVSLFVIIGIIERFRMATRKEMFIDKMLVLLKNVYQRTAPNDYKEMDLRGCELPDNVQVIKLHLHDKKSK